MKVNKKITLDFNEEESETLQHMAFLVKKNKSVLNNDVTPNASGLTNSYYDEKKYNLILTLANKIEEVK